MNALLRDIDVVKQIFVHKGVVGIFVFHIQLAVFVQVKSGHFGEVHSTLLVQADHVVVGLQRRGAGGQTQYGVGLCQHLAAHIVTGCNADLFFRVVNQYIHVVSSLLILRICPILYTIWRQCQFLSCFLVR